MHFIYDKTLLKTTGGIEYHEWKYRIIFAKIYDISLNVIVIKINISVFSDQCLSCKGTFSKSFLEWFSICQTTVFC